MDFQALAELAKPRGILTCADNTFASPYVQRPLEMGFDLVMHSATKYLNGHSDIIGGIAVVGENADLRDKLTFLQNAVGAVAEPVRQLPGPARPEDPGAAHGAPLPRTRWPSPAGWSAIRRSPGSTIPACESHPQHALAKRQMHDFGGMVTAILKGTLADAKRFLERCQIFALAESLGGVESLIEHPAIMTHASIPAEKRAELGISDGLVRLSVGIEDEADLIADLEQALAA